MDIIEEEEKENPDLFMKSNYSTDWNQEAT
jgi:hypothetical protein